MATYQFLSDEWLDEARSIRAEYEGHGGAIEHSVRMNLIVEEVPFGEGSIDAHADTSTGELVLDVLAGWRSGLGALDHQRQMLAAVSVHERLGEGADDRRDRLRRLPDVFRWG